MKRRWRADWEHRVEPIWGKDNGVDCKRCQEPVIGNGTVKNPWRHDGEPIERGVTG